MIFTRRQRNVRMRLKILEGAKREPLSVEERQRIEQLEAQYARTHPAPHRGISGCCDRADQL